MRTLHAVDGEPRAVLAALPGARDGTRPLALGFAPGPDDVVPDGTAVVIATSGSTGVPKRVVLSVEALHASARATERRIGEGQWMLALPAGYVAGLQVLVRSLCAGTTPALLEGRFTPSAFVEATSALDPRARSHTSLVPAQLETLLDAAGELPEVRAALISYDTILVGGQALPLRLRERAEDTGIRVVRTYGSSETSGGCVYDGIPLEGVRVAEHDGELRIRGAVLAEGYLGDPELTGRTFVESDSGTRWYRTGDAGVVADDGSVRVTGRIDNVIVSGGVNVSLDRVERSVREVPGLPEAVVVAVDDERWGQASVVVVTEVRDAAELLGRIRDHVGAALGAPARPREIRVVDALPLLPSGKPDRRALAALVGEG